MITTKELLKRIKLLEKRVSELEQAPTPIYDDDPEIHEGCELE